MNVANAAASVKSLVQEATETLTQTKAEAAKGDQQAIRKLANEELGNKVQDTQLPLSSIEGRVDAKA